MNTATRHETTPHSEDKTMKKKT